MTAHMPAAVPSPAARVAFIYVVVAGAWILVSDAVLVGLGTVWPVSPVKGLAFVLVTGVTLYRAVRHYHRSLAASERQRHEQARTVELLASRVDALIYRIDLDPAPQFVYVSPAATRLTGYTPHDHYADPGLSARLIHPADRQLLDAARAAAGPTCIRVRWRHRHGGLIWTETTSTPVVEHGRVVAIEGIARDITADVWQQRVAEVLAGFDDDLVAGDSAADRLGRLAVDLAGALDAAGCRLRHRATPATGWQTLADTLADPAAPAVHALSRDRQVEVLLNFTEPPRHQQQLRALLTSVADRLTVALTHRDRLRWLGLMERAINASTSAVIVTDPEGRIRWTNRGFETLTGYTAAEARGHTPRLLRSGQQEDPFYARLWATITRGEPFTAQLVNRRKDATLYEAAVTIDPVVDPGGQVEAFIGIQRDVTAENAERERLARLELDHLHRAQELEQDRALLVQTISHELRTPITIILGTAKTLQTRSTDPDVAARLLPSLERATADLVAKLDLLLSVTDDVQVPTDDVDLHELLRTAVDALPARYGRDRIHLLGDRAHWHGPGMLARAALRPLLDNALKFSPPDTPVDIHIDTDDDGLVIAITDHGPGLPATPSDHPDLLRQGDQTSTRRHGGLGLGLHAARRAAHRLGATLDLTSTPTGTTATLMLPANTEAAGAAR